MDVQITQWINALAGQNPVSDTLMIWITQFGVPVIVALAALLWWARVNRPHIRYGAICAGLSFLLGLGLNQLVLLLIHRVRPYDTGVTHLLIAPSADWSFPSDHATAVAAVAIAFAMARLPRPALVFSFLAALVCLSRIHVGTHYATDVLGGAFVGLVAAVLVRVFYRKDSRLNTFAVKIL